MRKVGRNDPCPCGSGKRSKHCCLQLDKSQAVAVQSDALPSISIHAALEHHQAGRMPQAKAIYQQILQAEPNHPEALHLLGVIAHQEGNYEIAVELISKAISVISSSPMSHLNLGLALQAQGKLDEAIESYQKALSIKPDYDEAHANLGNALKGKLESAVESYMKTLSIKPSLAEAHNRLGIELQDRRFFVPLQRTVDYAFYPRVPAISLELTNNCNLKCPYCANPTLERPKAYIEWELLEKIIDECAERQYNLAWLHGVGEPLLWKRLEEVITLIKRKGAGEGSFATNGTLLHSDRVKKLLDAGLENIYVSIDTLDPEIYKNTRGGKLEKVINNIQEMIRIVPDTFQITIALMNHKDHRITDETIRQFHQVFGYHDNVRTNLVENSLFPSAPGDYRVDGNKNVKSCFSPLNYLFIALDGRVAICCVDQEVLHSLGNAAERTIHDIWFDSNNQTTFRNIALGVLECPEVCIRKCVLSPPQQNVKMIDLGLGLPFDEASRFADMLLQNNEKTIAFSIFSDIAQRDPSNLVLQNVFNNLK